MAATDYVRSTEYESFIILCRECDRDDKYGAHNQYMLNLIYKEKGESAVSNMKHNKLLNGVKKNMKSAINFALKRKFEKSDKQKLKALAAQIDSLNSSNELLKICTDGIEVLLNYKPE